MIVHVEAAGRTRSVDIRRRNGRFIVTLDGQACAVDVSDVNGVWSLLIGPAEAAPQEGVSEGADLPSGRADRQGGGMVLRSHEVGFVEEPVGAMMVHVDGHPVPVSIPARTTWANRSRRATGTIATAGPQRITAPMPGKIVKILVKPGDRVEPRQGLIVVEAMKMENELRSRSAGTVLDVRVSEGSSVEAGALLIIVE